MLTLDEFLARPERNGWQRKKLIEGELVVSPGATVRTPKSYGVCAKTLGRFNGKASSSATISVAF